MSTLLILMLHVKGATVIAEWDDYILARESGIKRQWKPLLAERVNHIISLEGEAKNEYLNKLCHYYFDLGITQIPIQHPQIWNAILGVWKGNLSWDDDNLLLWIVKAQSFNGTYFLFKKDSSEILRRIIQLNPACIEAKKLLFYDNLHGLDFAMHSIESSGMLIERSAGEKAIVECETLLASEPSLKNCKTMFGGKFDDYKKIFLAWYEYLENDTDLDFSDWYKQ